MNEAIISLGLISARIKAIPIIGSNSVNNTCTYRAQRCNNFPRFPVRPIIIDPMPLPVFANRYASSVLSRSLVHFKSFKKDAPAPPTTGNPESKKNLKKCDIRGISPRGHPFPSPQQPRAAAAVTTRSRAALVATAAVAPQHTRQALGKFEVDGYPRSFPQAQQRLLPARRLLHLKKSQRLAK